MRYAKIHHENIPIGTALITKPQKVIAKAEREMEC
jgi:hypothetical protein